MILVTFVKPGMIDGANGDFDWRKVLDSRNRCWISMVVTNALIIVEVQYIDIQSDGLISFFCTIHSYNVCISKRTDRWTLVISDVFQLPASWYDAVRAGGWKYSDHHFIPCSTSVDVCV